MAFSRLYGWNLMQGPGTAPRSSASVICVAAQIKMSASQIVAMPNSLTG